MYACSTASVPKRAAFVSAVARRSMPIRYDVSVEMSIPRAKRISPARIGLG